MFIKFSGVICYYNLSFYKIKMHNIITYINTKKYKDNNKGIFLIIKLVLSKKKKRIYIRKHYTFNKYFYLKKIKLNILLM